MSQFTTSGPPAHGASASDEQSKTDAARGAAADIAGSAQGAATQVAGTAADQAKDVLAEAQTQARDLMGEGRHQLHEQARTTQKAAASSLSSLSDELRQMADNGGQSGTATEAARQIADRTGSLASWLDQREPGDALEEIRRFARRRPGMFLLGAALAGVAAGRLTRGAVAAAHNDASTPSTGQARPATVPPAAPPGWAAEFDEAPVTPVPQPAPPASGEWSAPGYARGGQQL